VAIVLLLTSLFSALGLGLMLNLSIEEMLTANDREASSLVRAADSALEIALHELGSYDTWNDALTGARTARFTDGAGSGVRVLTGGETIDLGHATDRETCGTSPCREPDIVARVAARPWGGANPRWRLFAWGRASALAGAAWPGDPYLLAWVADDPGDEDDNPARDAPAGLEGHGRLLLRAQAHGRRGARATVEALVHQRCAGWSSGPCAEGIRVQSWRVVE
jgi:hypothetical protein